MTTMDLALLGPPLLAGAVVLSTHVPLGRQVLARGIIFIDLAIAQLAGLGVILVHVVVDDPAGPVVQLAAFLAAVSGALALRWAERYWSDVLEAVIGVVFLKETVGPRRVFLMGLIALGAVLVEFGS